MNHDTIIRLARDAGISESHAQGMQGFLERFAALVAAAERKECARVAESYEPICDTCPSGVATAIRSRT